jgi:hypothetical protein
MSEASGREQMERRLVQRSLQDDAFRRRLLEESKRTVEEEIGTRLPEGVRVVAVEETAETIFLRLPGTSPLGDEGGELSDRELEAVAGGALGLTRPARAATPAFAPSRFALISSASDGYVLRRCASERSILGRSTLERFASASSALESFARTRCVPWRSVPVRSVRLQEAVPLT